MSAQINLSNRKSIGDMLMQETSIKNVWANNQKRVWNAIHDRNNVSKSRIHRYTMNCPSGHQRSVANSVKRKGKKKSRNKRREEQLRLNYLSARMERNLRSTSNFNGNNSGELLYNKYKNKNNKQTLLDSFF